MTESRRAQLDLVISNVRLFDGASIREGTYSVGIRRDKIEVFEARASEMTGKKEIDGAGRFLMPGIIDCHIHLFDFLNLKSQDALDNFIEGPLHEHLRDFLEARVTTVKSVGDSEDDILRVREMLTTNAIVGPRLLATGPCFNAPGSHPRTTVYGRNPWYGSRATVEPDSPSAAREKVRRLAERKVDAIKIIHHGGCRHGGPPYLMKLSGLNLNDVEIFKLERPVLEAIIDEAHKHGLKATVHTFDEAEAIAALEAGADGLEHGVLEQRLSGKRLIELLLANRATLVATLWLLTFDKNATEVRFANLKQVADAGVRVAIGTDSFIGFGKFGENTVVEMERATQAGIEPAKVLRMATKDAAQHLGANNLGTVAPGQFADLILVDGDPCAAIGALRNLSMVIKAGEIVVDKKSPA
jgi:imidazolonepropionase-like amidohydrolase